MLSGSAAELDDGRQLLMYTGVIRERQKNGGISEVQTQCLAVGDGTDYEKYEKNPVLDESDLPEGCSRFDSVIRKYGARTTALTAVS